MNTGLTPTSSFNAGNRREDIGTNIASLGATISASTLSARTLGATVSNGGIGASSSSNSNTKRGGTSSRNRKDDKKEFNPRLIFSQIVAMQCFHYVFLGLLFQINYMLFGSRITIDRIFTDQYIKLWSTTGLPDTFAVLLSSLVGAVLLAIIVEKSKKCLDFAFTLFVIHLGFCTAYGGIPRTWDWWIGNILGTIVMILLGEYVCSLREMSDIPLLQI